MYVKYVPRQQFMPTLYIKIPGFCLVVTENHFKWPVDIKHY